ncbi:MAG: HNH endonuclease [Patescibacteria group bacterium]
MPYPSKSKKIEEFYKVPFNNLAIKLYCKDKLSSLEIAERFLRETKVSISPRHIQRIIKSLGKSRNFSEAFNLAIKKGRKSYEHLRKPIKSSLLRKGIDIRQRYEILKRDNFRCVLCGNTAKETRLEIDHIKPVVNGGNNELDNLRILCVLCNRGKKFSEHEK